MRETRKGLVLLMVALCGCGSGEKLRRGLYVSDSAGAATEEDKARELLSLTAQGGFDTLVLYRLAPLLDSPDGPAALTTLLRRLRDAGVRTIAAPVGSVERVESLASTIPDGDFDALVTELEYWNECDTPSWETDSIRPDCFPRMQALVEAMRRVGQAKRLRLGAYLGSPTRDEVRWLSSHVDFVFLDYPIRSPSAARLPTSGNDRRRDRLAWCQAGGLEVWPIFYSRGEVPMQPWLSDHGLDAAEESFLAGLAPGTRPALGGFQYFADDGFTVPP